MPLSTLMRPILWVRNFFKPTKLKEANESRFRALTPVTDPEHYKKYAEAFNAIRRPKTKCIAVTGSYGAGKSSLLNSFIAENGDLKFLTISLAAFDQDRQKEDKPRQEEGTQDRDSQKEQRSKQEGIPQELIEKSILQQLLYSASSEQLPYSRFRKIKTPKHAGIKTFALTIFLALTFIGHSYWTKLESLFLAPTPWISKLPLVGCGLLWITCLWLIILAAYQQSFGLTLRKFSLKNAEIETSKDSTESIFNKHLDELLYFFQEVTCDVVIIEDLDRLGNTEIFTKIREINTLINSNFLIKEKRSEIPIRFIFAVRDDLFTGKERTKFFDLIIPVIPFVSGSNSYEILHTELTRVGLLDESDDGRPDKLKKKVLRNLCDFINDNRHLLNTVNEYMIYRDNLNSGEAGQPCRLDQTKLFGMIVYKTFFPKDFGELHDNTGVLSELLREHKDQIKLTRSVLIEERRELISKADELRASALKSRESVGYAYLGAIHAISSNGISSIQLNGSLTSFPCSPEQILSEIQGKTETLTIRTRHNYGDQISIEQISELVHPGLTLDEKLDDLEKASKNGLKATEERKREIATELTELRFAPLRRSATAKRIASKTSDFKNPELFALLIAIGLLDKDYADYTTYFHKGSITAVDKAFISYFQSSDTELEFPDIENPQEVFTILEENIFEKIKGFNVQIIDYLLSDLDRRQKYSSEIIRAIKEHRMQSLLFIQHYLEEGVQHDTFLDLVAREWPEYFDLICESGASFLHVDSVFQWLNEGNVKYIKTHDALLESIRNNAPEIFTYPKLLSKLKLFKELGIKIRDINLHLLPAEDFDEALDIIILDKIWTINVGNFLRILQHLGIKEATIKRQPVLSIDNAKDDSVSKYVQSNLEQFLGNCFLKIDESIDEPVAGISKIFSYKEINEDLASKIIARQSTLVDFDQVLPEYWPHLVKLDKFQISWFNIDYLANEPEGESLIKDVLSKEQVLSKLSEQTQGLTLALRNIIHALDEIPDETYCNLISPKLGKIEALPEDISPSKKAHLINSGMILLTEDSVEWVDGDQTLIVALILKNKEAFFEDLADFEKTLNNENLTQLLSSDLHLDQKCALLSHIDHENLKAKLRVRLEEIILSEDSNLSEMSEELVKALIEASKDADVAAILLRPLIKEIGPSDFIKILETSNSSLSAMTEYGSGKYVILNNTPVIAQLLEQMQAHNLVGTNRPVKDDASKLKVWTKHSPPE